MRNDIRRIAESLELQAFTPSELLEEINRKIELLTEFPTDLDFERQRLVKLTEKKKEIEAIIEFERKQKELTDFTLNEKLSKKRVKELTDYFITDLMSLYDSIRNKTNIVNFTTSLHNDTFRKMTIGKCTLQASELEKNEAYFKAIDYIQKIYKTEISEHNRILRNNEKNRLFKSLRNIETIGLINYILKSVK